MSAQNESRPWTTDDLARRAVSLRNLARSLVRDESRAEDLVQDTLVVALERPPRSSDSLSGWLATVARRLALDRARGERRRTAREEQVAREEAVDSPVRALEGLELEREVLDAVLALHEPYRTVVYLRYWEELGPAAIAAKLDVPLKTVKSRLSRALDELRLRLDSKVDGGRDRWVPALLPIAFPGGSASSGSGFGPGAGVAGGAWLVKKAFVGVVAVLLLALVWRVLGTSDGSAGQPLASNPHLHGVVPPVAESNSPPSAPIESPKETAARTVATDLEDPSTATGTLLVSLIRHDGSPGADMSIDVRFQDDPAPRDEFFRRRTDHEGRVLMTDVLAGNVEVVTDRGARFQVETQAGKRIEVELHLPEGLAVEGRVVGPGDVAVPGAELWIEGVRRGDKARAHLAARTGVNGSFLLDELGEDAQIHARATGFTASPAFEVSSLPLGPAGTRDVVLELGPAGAQVGGRVLDPMGRPVAGALVKIGARGGWNVDLANGLRATVSHPVPVETDAEGRFTYAGDLPEGFHSVTVSARGWPTWQSDVEVRAGARSEVDVSLLQPASIEGRVVDLEGTPVEGARVVASVEHMGGWHFNLFPVPRADTDAQGRFRLGWVAPGEQELNASVARRSELGKAKLGVKCSAGETRLAELVLDPGLTITGRVTDPQGKPLARWRIDARPEPYGDMYPRQTFTDEMGRFVVANLDAGHRYRVGASPEDHLEIHPRVESTALLPGATGVELVADVRAANASVRGRLLGQDGRVPGDLRVVFYPEGSNTGGYVDVDPSTGAFEKDALLPGRYELRVYRGGQTVFRTEIFDLGPGETKDVGPLVPEALGRLEIVLAGLSEEDLGRMHASLNREGHSTEDLAIESGVLRSRPIQPGKWKLGVHGGWFLRESELEVRADETTRVEVKPERGYEVRVACVFADPEAPWRTLTARASDSKSEVVEVGLVWFRHAMDGGRIRLHELTLPAGRFLVEATTETGLKGSEWVEVGPGIAPVGVGEIVMR